MTDASADLSPEPELAGDVRGLVKAELEPGERLLWAGRPVPKAESSNRSTLIGIAAVLVSGLVASFAFLIAYRAGAGDAAFNALVTGLIAFAIAFCVCLGLASGVSERRNARAKREGTLYALTDRRAILWVPEPAKGAVAVHTVPRGQVARVHRLEYPDGSGDVVFTFSRDLNRWDGMGGFEVVPGSFEGISDVRRVEEQVRRTLLAGPDPRPGETA